MFAARATTLNLMRARSAVIAAIFLALAPAAHAACPVSVSAVRGSAPLRVTFHAACDSAQYRWTFGDGTVAQGRTARHTYGGGRYLPVLTTVSGRHKLGPITSVELRLTAPRKADYGQTVTLRATVEPEVPVYLGGRRFRHGALRITVTQPHLTALAGPAVVRRTIVVRPRLDVALRGAETVGSPLDVAAVLRPAHAGTLQIRVDGVATSRVDTRDARTARIVVLSVPRPGWAAVSRVARADIRAPTLAVGAHGPAVIALEQRLRDLHYAVRDTHGVFDDDVQQAVYAFQDVNGLAPTGVVTSSLWTRLGSAGIPRARYGGDHVEVDKARQVLFRDGKVALVTHVSTGATGNTPLGVWHVYSKVPGWSWVLWYPSYFLRGFAIHGYPEVPPYPASHGCVRIPMWLAPVIYPRIPTASAVYIYA
jgi:peptidoglycan hydrolase-like protein with peptidoglycan-binding domain